MQAAPGRRLRRMMAVGLVAALAVGAAPAATAAPDAHAGSVVPVRPVVQAVAPHDGAAWATEANDFDGDGRADVVAARPNGQLVLYRGNGRGGWVGGPKVIGTGFYPRDYDVLTLGGDVDDDGHVDVLAIRDDDWGMLMIYPNNGRGGLRNGYLMSKGFGSSRELVAADVDGDVYDDLFDLGKYSPSLDHMRGRQGVSYGFWQYVHTWGTGRWENLMSPGDSDGDGRIELLYRETGTGRLISRPVNTDGFLTPVSRSKVRGTGWGSFISVLAPGDFNGDGTSDLIGQHANGNLMLYPGTFSGTFQRPVVIGTGWQGLTLL